MLASHDYGSVRYFSLAKSWAGRTIMSSGVYFVDGMLLDTGPANAHVEFASIIGSVDAEQVVLTHHHEDHAGNAVFAANHLDRAPLAHPLALSLLRKPAALPMYRKIIWGTAPPIDADALGATLHTREHAFEVIHTPGHAPDHVALYEPTRRWLFAGDLYLAPRLKLARDEEDLTQMMASLRELMMLPDCTLFCQHTGRHKSHQKSLGRKLDYLLGLQQRALVMHEEGRTIAEIVRELKLGKRAMTIASRGEFSAYHLVGGLLQDAGVESRGG